MDSEAFRKHGKEMVDIVADYWDSLEGRSALPDVKPGYIWDLIPKSAPAEGKSMGNLGNTEKKHNIQGEKWDGIFADLEKVVFSKHQNATQYYFAVTIGLQTEAQTGIRPIFMPTTQLAAHIQPSWEIF
jgi:hypothetical protein